jgi:hypothetical protein
MMPFNDFTDEVEQVHIETKSGKIVGPYRALFAGKTIVLDSQADVEDGAVVIRRLPNGKDERCYVTDYDFCRGMDGIEDHYQVEFRKGNPPELPKPSTTFNINGGQVQIGDNNTQNIINALQDLKGKIEGSAATSEQKEEAQSRLNSLLAHPLVNTVLGGLVGAAFL